MLLTKLVDRVAFTLFSWTWDAVAWVRCRHGKHRPMTIRKPRTGEALRICVECAKELPNDR